MRLLVILVIHCGLTSDTFLLNYGVLSLISPLYYNVITAVISQCFMKLIEQSMNCEKTLSNTNGIM